MTAPAVSASWASTFLGGKTGYQMCPRGCALLSSMESWEEATKEPEAVLLCTEEQQEQIHLGSKSLPPKQGLIRAECIRQVSLKLPEPGTPLPGSCPHALQPACLSHSKAAHPAVGAVLPSMVGEGNGEPKQQLPHL